MSKKYTIETALRDIRQELIRFYTCDGLSPENEINYPTIKDNILFWASGPSYWSVLMLGGDSIACQELGDYSLSPERRLQGLIVAIKASGLDVQCKNSYAIEIYLE